MAGFELYAGREPRHRRTWSAAIVGLGFVLLILSQIPPMIPWLMRVWPVVAVGGRPPEPEITGLFLIVSTGLFIALVLGWVFLFERRGPQALGLNHHAWRRFVRGYLIGAGFLVAVVGGLWALGVYTVEGPGVWRAPSPAAILTLLGWAAAFIVQGSSEELYNRGWLMGTLASRHGLILALILNSLLFGLLHLGNPVAGPAKLFGVANVCLFGIFISLYACRERSLWGACGFHAAWNWMLGLGFGLEVSGLKLKATPLIVDLKDTPGMPWYLSGGAWGSEASVLTTVILLAGIAYLLARGALRPGSSFETPEKPLPSVNFVRK